MSAEAPSPDACRTQGLMLDIKFKFNGREVSPEDLGRELQRSALATAADAIERRVTAIRCPVHGTSATIQRKPGTELGWDVSGCCSALTNAAQVALK